MHCLILCKIFTNLWKFSKKMLIKCLILRDVESNFIIQGIVKWKSKMLVVQGEFKMFSNDSDCGYHEWLILLYEYKKYVVIYIYYSYIILVIES